MRLIPRYFKANARKWSFDGLVSHMQKAITGYSRAAEQLQQRIGLSKARFVAMLRKVRVVLAVIHVQSLTKVDLSRTSIQSGCDDRLILQNYRFYKTMVEGDVQHALSVLEDEAWEHIVSEDHQRAHSPDINQRPQLSPADN